MKVKDFIKYLAKLDQEKDIHLIYDGVYILDLEVEIADEYIESDDITCKKGDYIIKAS